MPIFRVGATANSVVRHILTAHFGLQGEVYVSRTGLARALSEAMSIVISSARLKAWGYADNRRHVSKNPRERVPQSDIGELTQYC